MASRMASAANGGGTKIMVALAPFSTASATVFQTGILFAVVVGPGLAAFTRGNTADELRAVFDGAVAVEGAHFTGDALADEFGIFVY